MKCRCCLSLRSLVYFCTSIHVFLGFILFGIFSFKIILHFRAIRSSPDVQPSLTLISFFVLLAGALFFPLGCALFKGVEKEARSLIKYPAILFFIMKIVDLSLKIYQEFEHQQKRRDEKEFLKDWETRIYQSIDVLGSATYLVILYIYYRSLVRQKRYGKSKDLFFLSNTPESATLTKRRPKEVSDNESFDNI